MTIDKKIDGNLFQGFSKLNREERFHRLMEMGALSKEDLPLLKNTEQFVKTDLAEHFIENVIGYFHMPMGVAANVNIDGKDIAIPMAVEETSIIAAVSKTAKWIRQHGSIETWMKGHVIIGQIQLAHVSNFKTFEKVILQNKAYLIELANADPAAGLVKRGGGVTDVQVRKVSRSDGGLMAVVHIHLNACDAMGANIVNQVCEFLKEPIEKLTHEHVTMCILSNLTDTRLACAKVTIHNVDSYLGEAIQEASHFAKQDPYRAATNNKGVLNGMDPILIATGNDWRALEAGVHAYAARSGQYRSITDWRMEDGALVGTIEAPVPVGTVGGMTKLHPMAQFGLKLMGVKHADELSCVVAAVGLIQNLGAIKALCTEGIIQGHMKLHINNLALGAGAKEKELPLLRGRLEEILKITKRISLQQARDVLKELRRKAKETVGVI